MRARTRYFVIFAALVLLVGLGTGLVAYYVGLPGGVFSKKSNPDELTLLPRDAGLVAHVQIRQVMDSPLRQRIKKLLPPQATTGQQELLQRTGIDLERDVEHLTAAVVTGPHAAIDVLVLVKGKFDDGRIEGLMRDSGGRVEEYKGTRLVLLGGPASSPDGAPDEARQFSLAFLEPGLVAVGSRALIRGAVDRRDTGDTAADNPELMALVKTFKGHDAWAIGRLDALQGQRALPADLTSQLPAVNWFAAGADVDAGLRATLQVEAADPQAAKNLRDIIEGAVAVLRFGAASQPAIKQLTDSLVLGGRDRNVSLTFNAPAEVFDPLFSGQAFRGGRPEFGGPRPEFRRERPELPPLPPDLSSK